MAQLSSCSGKPDILLLRLDFGEAVNAIAPLGADRLAVGGFGGLVVFQFPERKRR